MPEFSFDAEHPSGLCCLCDNAVEEFEEHAVIRAYGGKYLAHAMCAEDMEEVDDDA